MNLKNRQVDLHSEDLRSKWVAHKGQKELQVNCDEFVKGKTNNWASTVSGKPDSFSEQIKVGINEYLDKQIMYKGKIVHQT